MGESSKFFPNCLIRIKCSPGSMGRNETPG
jgi:hypothetical protein